MRRKIISLVAVMGLVIGSVNAGDLNDDYFQAVGDYHGVSYEEVFAISDAIGVNDVAAAYAIATRSSVSIDKVVELRSDNESWAEVAKDCGLTSVDFYIMISGPIKSKTFGPTFQKYAAVPSNKMGAVSLSDDEVVNLTNLRLISSHHDYSMFDVIAMKDIGSDWPRINQKVAGAKQALAKKYAKR